MKTKFILISLASAIITLAGCSSTPVSLSNYEPVAIVCITGNQTIELLNQKGEIDTDSQSGLITSTINRMADPDNPEYNTYADRLDYADGYIRSALSDTTGITIIDKELVINNDYYKTAVSSFTSKMDPLATAPGYRLEMSRPWGKNAKVLARTLNAKSLVSFKFDFAKRYTSPAHNNCELEAVVILTVTITDENGRTVEQKKFKATSDKTVTVRGGKYDKWALVNLYPQTIENTVNKFVVSYIN